MDMSIREVIDYCKPQRLYTALIIILVGFGSFGLGRLSVSSLGRDEVRISIASEAVNNELFLVGSRTGKKYYFPWCAGAARISTENKITFASLDEAEAAGFTPADNCKGLE